MECGAHQLARRRIPLTKDQQVCMMMELYYDVSPEVAELFALMSEDPEGRLRLQRGGLHKFTWEAKGRTIDQFSRGAVRIFTPRCTNFEEDH